MEFISTSLNDVLLIKPRVFGDSRGFFFESFRASEFTAAGIDYPFTQDNHSGSRQGILRGLHYQVRQPQGKLVRAVAGEVYDVAVDIRRGSSTYGRWVGQILSAENKLMIWIPPGLAHGFYVMSEWAEVVYKATDYYAPEWERTLLWNDPALGIPWPLIQDQPPLLSEKDQRGCRLSEIELAD